MSEEKHKEYSNGEITVHLETESLRSFRRMREKITESFSSAGKALDKDRIGDIE